MKAAVIIFPGSNCDRDAITTLQDVTGIEPHKVWHGDSELPKVDVIVVPGGFSYGDYLRSGAMAARSPIMQQVVKAANAGVHVLGICNGFQILTETGLLPGTLMRNKHLKFICRDVQLAVQNSDTAFTGGYKAGQQITIPIAHHDGNYVADADTIKKLNDNNQVAFRYVNNPNGSLEDIAGILNERKNVLGMMPHPERLADPVLGGVDGRTMFESLLKRFS